MKVALFFWYTTEEGNNSLKHAVYGRYDECGIMFVGDSEIEAFYTMANGVYRKYTMTKKNNWSIRVTVDFLLLSVDEEEQQRLKSTCVALAATQKPYNLKDELLRYVPFINQIEMSIFEAKTLNNPQALVLLLRECLSRTNPLRLGLEGLHSRQTFAETLFDRLSPHCLPVLWSNLVGQLKT